MATKRRIGLAGAGLLALLTLLKISSTWGTPAPALRIAYVGTNTVSLTVTNPPTTNQVWNLYWTEYLSATSKWDLIAMGTNGQCNFLSTFDTKHGFFKALLNTNGLPPTLTVTIISPANGSVVQ